MTYNLLGSVKASAVPGTAQRPQEEVFSNTPLPLARHNRHPGMAASATRTGIGVSAGITGGARRSRRLQGLPPTMGRASSQRGFSASEHR